MGEGHLEVATALRDGTEVGDIAEHLGERDLGVDFLRVTALDFARHVATAA